MTALHDARISAFCSIKAYSRRIVRKYVTGYNFTAVTITCNNSKPCRACVDSYNYICYRYSGICGATNKCAALLVFTSKLCVNCSISISEAVGIFSAPCITNKTLINHKTFRASTISKPLSDYIISCVDFTC